MKIELPNPKEFPNHKANLIDAAHHSKPIESISLEQIANEFNGFEPLSERHTKHLLALYPEWMFDNANDADLEYFTSMVRYDRAAGSLVAAIIDNKILEAPIISYKWRYKDGVKWRTRTGTHPNNTPLYRVWSDEQPIVVVEGIRDFIAGVLLGWNVIGIPTASYRGSIDVKSWDRLLFFIEDEKAEPVMMRLAGEASPIAQNISYVMPGEVKRDLSDICFQCSSIEGVWNEIARTKRA